MTSAFEPTPQHDLTFAPENAPLRHLAFAPVMTAKALSALGRLLPAFMIVLGAFATVGWGGLLLWLLFRIMLMI
jgi:hypothetical protein